MTEGFRRLPAVGRLLSIPQVSEMVARYGNDLVTGAIREELDRWREKMRRGATPPGRLEDYVEAIAARIEQRVRPRLRTVINGTGVILNTNLGRSPLHSEAVEAVLRVASRYNNLEYDLGMGARGSRQAHIREVLCSLTGAEDSLVVNNNAAALWLILDEFSRGREVIVSRGELVEIGGSFRLPDIMAKSGVILREVGTTNRTYAADYVRAVNENTAMLLKVHQSNFRQVGFTAQARLEELAGVAREKGLILVEDQGSGTLVDTAELGLPRESTVAESLSTGADLVCFSGDKLLGGPQAGIITGRGELIRRLAANPAARMLRVDKMTLAALEATLTLYREGRWRELPVFAAVSRENGELEKRAEALIRRLGPPTGARMEVARVMSAVGGGALPGFEMESRALAIITGSDPQPLADELRWGDPPVLVRVGEGSLLIDLRTVRPDEEDALATALRRVLSGRAGGR